MALTLSPVVEIKINGISYRAVDYTAARGYEKPFWSRVQSGEWEPQTFEIFRHFLQPNRPYLDLGAWIGPTVLYGSQLAKHCFAVEPDPVAQKDLGFNLNLNPNLQGRVTLYEGAISDTGGIVQLGSMKRLGESDSSLVYPNPNNICLVDSLRFEDFVARFGVVGVNFIKIDIEGSEILILPGMRNYLRDEKPTMHLSLHPYMFPSRAEYAAVVMQVVSLYRLICTNDGERLDSRALEDLILSEEFFDIVVTDK